MVPVHPLILLREHPGGIHSAAPAADATLVAYAPDPAAAVAELRLFLSGYLAKAGADAIQSLVLAEEATTHELKVTLPYGTWRTRRIRTRIGLSALVVPARHDARWLLIPVLDHVCYVPAEQLSELNAIAGRDVERRLHASALDAGAFLGLLPPLATSIERIEVELEPPHERGDARSNTFRDVERKRKEARDLLERIGRPLTPNRQRLAHRAELVATLQRLFESKERTSVVVVGAQGTGKSALIQAALGTRALVETRPTYITSGAELVAGQSFVGQLEERVEAVMKAVALLDAVLYFEALDDLFAGRGGGYQDLASLMRRFVVEGRVRILGELTSERFDRLQHQHVGFFSQVQRVEVPALNRAQTLDVLVAGKLEPAPASVLLDLIDRYFPGAALPGVAVRFAGELSSRLGPQVTTDDVYRATSARTGVPEFLLRDERSLLLEEVTRFFRSQIVGQHEAIEQVAEVLCRIKAGVAPKQRPLATFLFVGPTGVGKTELAKALARYLFGSADRLARFDMSEYRGPLAAERLIRGTDREDGVLTRRIREQPFTVLLLDEIEKADPGVFDLLLQLCGEGRLSDAQGKLAHFNNAIVIMTSNLGSQHRHAPVGFGSAPALGRDHYVRQVRESFRPEFVNRLDRIVAFESLTREQMVDVTELSIERIRRREGLVQRSVDLKVSPAARRMLAEDGYSAAYGARGLRRHLEHALVAPLATLLARLGARAPGVLLSVRLTGESESSDGEPIGTVEKGGLSTTAFGRADPKRRNAPGALEISRLRREVSGWHELPPIADVRERVAEITAELAAEPRANAKALGRVLGDLSAELGRLSELLSPLDEAARELETIEGMVVSALAEGGAPELFEEDARRAHARSREHLIPALMVRNSEREVALVAHELEERRVLQRWLLPLLEYTRKKGWQVLIHVDRDEGMDRAARGRRWGPARSREDYVARYGQDPEPRFSNALVRVRGHAAGALLSLMHGRWVYPVESGRGQVWVRIGGARYELSAEELAHASLTPLADANVGRKQDMRFDLRSAEQVEEPGTLFEDVTEENFFEHYERMIFNWLVDIAARGEPHLPGMA